MKPYQLIVTVLAVLLAGGPHTDVGYADVFQLEEQVVTASRRAASPQNAPAVVDVITAEDIALTPAVNLAQLLETLAGIYAFSILCGRRGQPAGYGSARLFRGLPAAGANRKLLNPVPT